jgi:hypothetical protein
MHVVRKLEALIAHSRSLLALEVEHLQRVLAAGLDATDAQWTVDRRCRYIERLELQHDRVLMHRLAMHQTDDGAEQAMTKPDLADADPDRV